jgi:ABC-2 type transport system permease protein
LLLLIFTLLLGGAIAGSVHAYIRHLLPGILVLTVLPMTVYTGTTLCTDIAKGVYDRFRTMPFWQPAAVAGAIIADSFRYLVALPVVLAAGMALGFRPENGLPGAALACLYAALLAFAASWIFAAIGIVVKQPETVSGSSMMIIYPLLFASNVLVDTATMPRWLGRLIELNPVSIAASTVRVLMHGTAGGTDIAAGIGLILLILAVFIPLTFRLYRRRNRNR